MYIYLRVKQIEILCDLLVCHGGKIDSFKDRDNILRESLFYASCGVTDDNAIWLKLSSHHASGTNYATSWNMRSRADETITTDPHIITDDSCTFCGS